MKTTTFTAQHWDHVTTGPGTREGVVYKMWQPGEEYSWLRFKCPCGCGEVVELPAQEFGKPHVSGWWFFKDDFMGPTISPSINQIGYACKSHYSITNGKVT